MRLCFLGDSLIEYFNWQARFPRHQIVNLGIAGETATGLLARLPAIIRQDPSPDLVMVMTGTNDLAMEDYGLLTAYQQILAELRAGLPQTKVLAASLLPFRVSWIAPDAVPRINNGLATLCHTTGATFLDIYPLFIDSRNRPRTELFLADNIHLSDQGYGVWSGALAHYLNPQMDRPF